MANTGFVRFETVENWSGIQDPSNLISPNNGTSAATLNPSTFELTDLSFSLPQGSIITGIEFQWAALNNITNVNTYTASIILEGEESTEFHFQPDYASTPTLFKAGGENDLIGLTNLTATNVSNITGSFIAKKIGFSPLLYGNDNLNNAYSGFPEEPGPAVKIYYVVPSPNELSIFSGELSLTSGKLSVL